MQHLNVQAIKEKIYILVSSSLMEFKATDTRKLPKLNSEEWEENLRVRAEGFCHLRGWKDRKEIGETEEDMRTKYNTRKKSQPTNDMENKTVLRQWVTRLG